MSKLPDGWRLAEIRDFAHYVRRPIKVIDDEYYRQIGIRSHGLGIFHKEPITGKEIGNKRIFWIEPGDFVVNIVFAWEDAVALVSEAERGMCASHRFPTIVVDKNLGDAEFLLRHFQSQDGIEQLKAVSPGGAGRNKTLNQSAFLKLKIPLPPLEEQRKIVAILSTWDEAIGLVEQLIAALGRRKQALMQLLLTGAVRFAGFEGEWEETKFGLAPLDIIDGDRGENYPKQDDFSDSDYCLFLNAGNVTKNGFDFSNCSFISVEKDKSLRKGKLTRHDTVLTTRGTVGNIAYYDDSVPFQNIRINSGMVLLRAHSDKLNPRYLYLYMHSPVLVTQIKSFLTGSAQQQLPISIMKGLEISFPNPLEQQNIAEVLTECNQEIEYANAIKTAYQTQKRGLMQQLLTGAVRV